MRNKSSLVADVLEQHKTTDRVHCTQTARSVRQSICWMWWNRRFASWMCCWQICSNCVILSCWYGPKFLGNVPNEMADECTWFHQWVLFCLKYTKRKPLKVGRSWGLWSQHLFMSWIISEGVSSGIRSSAGRSPLRTHWLIWSSLLASGHKKMLFLNGCNDML